MKTKKSNFLLLFLIAIFFLANNCKKIDYNILNEGQLEFSFSTEIDENIVQVKSAIESDGISAAIISIEDRSGSIVKDMEEIELLNMNGNFISKPISLLAGDYKLTKFMLVDDRGNILYATPKESSPKAYLVDTPLDIQFSIIKDKVIKLKPEVISTQKCIPEDFGYASFGFNIIKTFDFLISVFIYDSNTGNFELTEANLSVKNNGAELYSGDLEPVTNTITLKDNYDLYELNISKRGYNDYSQVYTNEELKSYFRDFENGPLVVILESQGYTTITLQPGPQTAKDAHLWSCRPNEQRGDYYYFESRAWSWVGQNDGSGYTRSLLEFDLSQIKQDARIVNAKLSLYGINCDVPNSTCAHSSLSGSNESVLLRIIESWDEFDVTWNNQPNTTSENQVWLRQSTELNQDYIDIDVTQLIQDIINSPNESYGLMLKLVTEEQYRALVFYSSDGGVPEKYPKLSVSFVQ